jgi:hypothetical protein
MHVTFYLAAAAVLKVHPPLLSSKDNQDSAGSLQTTRGCKKTTGTTTTTTTTTMARTMPDKTPKMGKKFGEKV